MMISDVPCNTAIKENNVDDAFANYQTLNRLLVQSRDKSNCMMIND